MVKGWYEEAKDNNAANTILAQGVDKKGVHAR